LTGWRGSSTARSPPPPRARANWRAEPGMAKGRSQRRDAVPAGRAPGESDKISAAALACIARQGWRRLSLADIAAEAGLPILRVYRLFSSKPATLCGFFRRIDEAVLAAPPEGEPDERPRDRVFDLLMRRFDALPPYRAALDVLARDLPTDPLAALAAGAGLRRAMRPVPAAPRGSGAG